MKLGLLIKNKFEKFKSKILSETLWAINFYLWFLFNHHASISAYIALSGWMITEKSIGEAVEGSDRGLIKTLPRHLLRLNKKRREKNICWWPEWGSNRAPPVYKAEALLPDNLLAGSMMGEARKQFRTSYEVKHLPRMFQLKQNAEVSTVCDRPQSSISVWAQFVREGL